MDAVKGECWEVQAGRGDCWEASAAVYVELNPLFSPILFFFARRMMSGGSGCGRQGGEYGEGNCGGTECRGGNGGGEYPRR